LLESKWPNVEQMLEATTTHPALFPVPAGLFDALAVLAPFCNERRQVFFHGSCIATTAQPQSSGTAISIDNVPNGCCFNIDHLLNLQGVADFIAFNNYPATSLFTGSVARGVICGTKP